MAQRAQYSNVALQTSTVCHAIERWAELQPDHTALSYGSDVITYSQLDAAATHIAWLLSTHGLGRGDKVPVLARRCPEMIACYLAVLKLGALYVPIDTESWSSERIEWTLQKISARVLVNTTINAYAGYEEVPCLKIEDFYSPPKALDGTSTTEFRPWDNIQPDDDLAYIIFTSGTTSTPKGVMVSHSSLLNYTQQGGVKTPFNFNATPDDQVVLIFSPAFDACTGVIFATLCNGAELRVATVADFIHSVTLCNIVMCTPSMMSTIQDPMTCSKLRMIVLGGEAPPVPLVRKWQQALPDCEVWNFYGPTETTCASLAGRLLPGGPIHLGHPMSNSRILLIDGDKESDDGEMYIGGPGVAKGYFENEALTAEKFVSWRGERMYRTGDFARITPSGFEFVGRKDSLVKNRGFLVNLDSQVIPILSDNEQVTSATAFMYQGRLIGFVSPANVDTKALKKGLAAKHDAFMVPDSIRALDILPLTPNAKIDNRALQRRLDDESAAVVDINWTPEVDGNGINTLEVLRAALSASLTLPLPEVDPEQSFQELGGNSLIALKVQSFLRRRGLEVRIVDLFTQPSVKTVCDKIEQSTPDSEVDSSLQIDEPRSSPSTGPASTTQMKMIQAGAKRPETSYMLMRLTLPHPGSSLSAETMQSALSSVLQRHATFRTAFSLRQGLQHIQEELKLSWSDEKSTDDCLESTIATRSEALRRAISVPDQSEMYSPITACHLITIPRAQSTLLMLLHHSLIDGWSFSIVLNELRLALDGRPLPTSRPYLDATLAQRKLANDVQGRKFWNKLLERGLNQPPITLLPPPSDCQASCWSESLRLGLDLNRLDLEDRAKSRGVTPASIFYATWAMVLSHHSFTDDVSFGVVLSGRNMALPGVDQIVGPMLNTCPFPLDLNSEATADALLKTTQTRLLNIMEHQWSADEAMSNLSSGSIANTFQSIVVMEYDLPPITEPCEALNEPWKIERKDCMEFGISVLIEEDEDDHDGLQIRILYDGSRYAGLSIQTLLAQFRQTLHALLDERRSSLHQVRESLREAEEASSMIPATLKTPYDGYDTVKDAFEAAAAQWPDLTALESVSGSLTYRELDEAADRIANHLRSVVASADDSQTVVAVLTDGSLHWITSLLGVLKAGFICCPVDVHLPSARIDTILQQSGASIALAANPYCASSVGSRGIETFVCEDLLASQSTSCAKLATVSAPKDVIYLVFTSGSTGIPKGVALHNRSLLLVIDHEPARLFTKPGRRNSQVYSVGFDVVTVEIFGTLCHGGTLVLKDPADPLRHLRDVDATFATPSLLAALSPEDLPNLDTLVLAGEPVPQSLADAWSHKRLFNGYGPSECGPLSTMAHLQPGQPATIGRAMPHLNVYLLDHHQCPVPPGVTGEIYISGEQIIQRYWNLPEQTTKSFLPNPFSAGTTMYKTGDLGRWTGNGELAYVGRVDNQVKVRGYRIELEEIERALVRADPTVQRAAVVVVDSVRIVAFVTPGRVDTSAISSRIKSLLPAYARPAQITALDELPKSANLKTDRHALLDLASIYADQGETPSTATEQLVAKVWRTVLNIDDESQIKRDDDFLGIGGNSLLAIKAARLISEAVGCRVPVPLLIRETVLSSLSKAIDDNTSKGANDPSDSFLSYVANSTHSTNLTTSQPLSQIEDDFYAWHAQSYHKSLLNTAFRFEIDGQIDIKLLEQAFNIVVADNPILRARYVSEGASMVRRVVDQVVPPLMFTGDELNISELQALVEKPFDLEHDQLLRVVLWEGAAGSTTLVLITHHLITDKASLTLLLQSVSKTYIAAVRTKNENGAISSIPKRSYVEWSEWLRRQQQSPPSASHREKENFWKNRLLGTWDRLPRITQHRIGSEMSGHWFTIMPRVEGSKASQRVAMAATALALKSIYNIDDMVLGLPYMNRDEPGSADLMGLFLDRLPIRLTLTELIMSSAAEMMDYTASEIHLAVENQLAYYQILEAAGTSTSVFDVMVIYHWQTDALEHSIDLPNTRVSSTPIRASGAKFPLQLEFSELEGDRLRLDIEYDGAVILPTELNALTSFLSLAVERLMQQVPPGEILAQFESRGRVSRSSSTDAMTSLKGKDGRPYDARLALAGRMSEDSDTDSGVSLSFDLRPR